MKVRELLENTKMHKVTRGTNIDLIGQHEGYVVVKFRSKDDMWIYGSDIPEGTAASILRVPFPDKHFTLKVKNPFKAYKVEACQNTSPSKQ